MTTYHLINLHSTGTANSKFIICDQAQLQRSVGTTSSNFVLLTTRLHL